MSFNLSMLEDVVAWCRDNADLETARQEARSHVFGDDDERPVEYWPGTGELTSKERRFLGYFLFCWELPSGEHPAEVAVKRLFTGATQAEALLAVRGERFVFALVTAIVGQRVYVEVGDEQFEVRSSQWAATLHRGLVVVTHLVPVRHGHWLPGPGWAELPLTLGEGMRANLAEMQMDPITFERMLQGRSRAPDEEPRPKPPRDEDIEAAVSRMTFWAKERGVSSLIRVPADWKEMVVQHMLSGSAAAMLGDVLGQMPGPPGDEAELNELSGLLMNIWNNTPQPDRGGKSANQLVREYNKSAR